MRWFVAILAACTPARPDLAIDRIEPATGRSTNSTPVRIEGSFRLPITSDVDTGSTVVGEMFVDVGGTPLGGATWQNDGLIEGVVPAGLALGLHDVTVRLGSNETILDDGFLVSDDALPGDGGTTPCTFGPWGARQAMADLNVSGFDAMPRFSADELTVYLHSLRAGGVGARDIWSASRTSLTAPFGAATNVTAVNSANDDRDPSPTNDGLTILLTSTRAGGVGGFDLYIAERASIAQPFSTPQLVPGINTGGTEYFGFLTPDGLALYWSSTRSGNADIWYSTRPTRQSAWSTPQALDEVNSTAGEYAAVPSADGLELYVTSSRVTDDSDIWVATRTSTSMPFGAPVHLPMLSTANDEDLVAWISSDGLRIYQSSGVSGSAATIYMATRTCQ